LPKVDPGPFSELGRTFAPLRDFAKTTGDDVGFGLYRTRLATVAAGVNRAVEAGGGEAAMVFGGGAEDPLLNGWQHARLVLDRMGPELSEALSPLLLGPFEQAAEVLGCVLAEHFNGQWETEVVQPFRERLAGRYPFSGGGPDALFADFADFFRPETGTFWGFHDRVLSRYAVRTVQGWVAREVQPMCLRVAPQLLTSLATAERIRTMFFRPTGELRGIGFTVTPSRGSVRSSLLEVCGQKVELGQGRAVGRFVWPAESHVEGAQLRVQVGESRWAQVAFDGPWGLMRLVDAGRAVRTSGSTLHITWQVSVQNVYLLQQTYCIEATGGEHMLGNPVFGGFTCPERAMAVPQAPLQAAYGFTIVSGGDR
jgi:type VI secretion system protein ImpL